MTKEEKFEDKNPTYTWQYPVAEYWDIPFILKKQSVSLEFGYKNHFSLKKKKMEKTLMQVIEEKEEDNEKYKPEEQDINYFDKGDLENQNKNDQFFNKNKKLVIEGEEKKKKKNKNKNNQGENWEDSENEDKQEKYEEDSDEYKNEKQINVKEFEPNEDYFDHRQMQNLDDLLDRNQEDGSAYPTYNNLYSNQTSRMGTQIRNGKTIIINGSQYGNKSYTSIYPNSKRTTKRLQTTMTNQSRRTGTSKKTLIGNQTNFPDDMDQYGNFLYFKKKPKDFTRLDKLRGNRNPDESYSEQGDLSESENNSLNQSQFGNYQQRKVKSRQQTVIKEDISEMNFSKNDLDNTNMENSKQQEYIQEKILHPYDVQKTYAKEVLKRQGAKQYDEHRNSDTESVDSWASQNDWATLKKRDYYYKEREFAGPQTPSIFQSSTNSWHKSGELFFLPQQQQLDFNREELNDLWHDLFGDLTEQHKKDKQKEFQEIIREGKQKLEAFPKPLPNLFFVVHFLKNFKHQKINLRVAIVKDDTYLSIGQNEIIIHKEIHGKTNVKRSNDKTEYFQLEVDYQAILPLDLQHLKQFFTPKELLNIQLFVTFFDKDGVKGWFFHPLYVEDQELVKQNAPRKQLEKYEGSQFLKPTYGNFQVKYGNIKIQRFKIFNLGQSVWPSNVKATFQQFNQIFRNGFKFYYQTSKHRNK
ncbi:hypothetical protein PPERSA_06450 [Pseudocohnilembus persalinus]|uniref:Uncharacterized protein n=1 Tax=Pseudocohnilembus persalinus TaxID=266149 RepID=A0A0V0QS28_PSEPJ|nr:hypothetical protein PPERSA_06450 [Pseudocohnilembus persalinus]|eukprot:KRX04816.1 hypothetical protein PPERSA_06450 [Pseudocohnilembus persalinus]